MEIKYRTQFGELLEHLGLKGDAAEIGVAEGRNAEVLISKPAIEKLYLIDAWTHIAQPGDGGYHQSWHDNNWKEVHERVEPWKDKAVFLKGLSGEMIKQIPDDSLIFGYVDGDHTYHGCLSDLNKIYPKITKGGVLAGHDFLNFSYGVNKAVGTFIFENHYIPNDIHVTEEDGDISMVSFWLIKK